MTQSDVEYSGMMAEYWDLFRGDTSQWEDRSFYLEIIAESGQPVLDVGCGTGRLLLDYQSQGVDIDGVDISSDMIEICRQKAKKMELVPRLYLADMETMSLPRQYRTILVPSSSFQLVVESERAKKVLSNLFSHLLPSGTLVMPFMKVWKEGFDNSWRQTGEKNRPGDGATVKRWSRNWFDPRAQLEHTEDRYEVIRDGVMISSEQHMRSPATREYTQNQAQDLYAEAGFLNLRIYKGFSHESATQDDEIFTICGMKP